MSNLRYYPRLPNGKGVTLTLPMKMFRSNSICWPIENNVSWFRAFDRFIWIFGFLLFSMHNDAELRYLRVNFHNLDDFLTGVPTYLVLCEVHIRAFTLGLQKDKFKDLLQRFFAEIYIEKSQHPKQFRKIERQIWPVYIVFIFFTFTLISYTVVPPVYFLATGQRELIYKMIPLIEYKENFFIYFPLLLSNIWVGYTVVSLIAGEANMLATLIFHLNGRYVFLRQNFHKKIEQLLKSGAETDVVAHYRRIIIETLQENLKLNKFAEDVQNEFSLRLFIVFSFSAITLCALGFKVYTSPMTSIGYIFWTVGKIQEILAWGAIGTTIITTTDDISSMYYESNWESVVARSTNSRENIRLMKLLNLSMTTNRKPFNLSGLNFFNVSLTAVLTILQGAFSYFTCLIALR